MILQCLRTDFSCAHFYHQTKWDQQRNQETFGLCFNPFGHGHDYVLEVCFKPELASEVSLRLSQLKTQLDHQHLNHVIPEFKNTIPTTENLALYCWGFLGNQHLQSLKLYEKTDLWVEINQGSDQ